VDKVPLCSTIQLSKSDSKDADGCFSKLLYFVGSEPEAPETTRERIVREICEALEAMGELGHIPIIAGVIGMWPKLTDGNESVTPRRPKVIHNEW
jgi:hypothetical protein